MHALDALPDHGHAPWRANPTDTPGGCSRFQGAGVDLRPGRSCGLELRRILVWSRTKRLPSSFSSGVLTCEEKRYAILEILWQS